MNNIEKKVFNGLMASSIVGSALSGCTPVKSPNTEQNDHEKNPPLTQVLTQTEMDDLNKGNAESEFVVDTTRSADSNVEDLEVYNFEVDRKNVERIEEIINIQNWFGYKVESVENLDPAFYTPMEDSTGSLLWVIPLREGGFPNREEEVLMYNLLPNFENTLKVTAKITIKTPEGETLNLGVADMGDEVERGARFITLLSVEKDGDEISFLEESEKDFIVDNGEEEEVNSGYFHQANVALNLFRPEVETYEQISEVYDPEYYLIGTKYESKDVVNFMELFDENSISNNFSKEYLLTNQLLNDLSNLSMEINSLPLERENILDSTQTREYFSEIKPSSLLYDLYLSYPELNIPLGAYGYYQHKEGDEWVIEPAFAEEVLKRFNDKSFYGKEIITVAHRDYKEGLDFHNEMITKDFQFEFHAGDFSIEDFEVGDVILLEKDNGSGEQEVGYMVVIGIEERDGEMVLGLVQADRFDDERLEVFASRSPQIFELLGVEQGSRICLLRGN